MTQDRVTRTIYIGSGLKNGFYTLRSQTVGCVGGSSYSTDQYLRNLSTDPDKAEAAARAYFDRVYGDTCLDVSFAGFADFDLTPWGQGLEPWERAAVHTISAGVWPFGKHKGLRIADAPDGYLLYWAELAVDASKRVQSQLVEVCRSIADERGLRAKVTERRRAAEERREQQAATSRHVFTVGERRDVELTVQMATSWDGTYGTTYFYSMTTAEGDVVVGRFSQPLALHVDSRTFRPAVVGSVVRMKATVKSHEEYKGVKQTVLQRPKVSDVVAAPVLEEA